MNKIYTFIVKLTNKKELKQIASVRSEYQGITIDPADIKRTIREYYKQCYA